ncbi:5399_t:CDS:2 [Ambispora leptoticha]|uniref:5399_t:CDS:1 n=1 Tax=Ambispora leptoticha TaxID=144679 RepID=A0A9N9EQ19_9GLOM|nr:5399_t:CDS:2 [Ambispora leptoticha]
MTETLETFEISNGYDRDSLKSAKDKAANLRHELNGENPMLAIISSLTLRFDEGYSFEKAGVRKFDLPSDAINNPDQYIKPLDIVSRRIGDSSLHHVAVYLGNRQVAHIYDPDSSFSSSSSGNKARKDSWSEFLVSHIAKAIVEGYKEGKYDVFEENCEHFASEIVLGIDFSRQAEARKKAIGMVAESLLMNDPQAPLPYFFPDPSSFTEEINLQSKINETNEKLDNLAKHKTSAVENKVKEIKNHDESQ